MTDPTHDQRGTTPLGLSGRIAATFQSNALTPLLALVALLLGLFAVLVTPREEEPQINVTMANVITPFPGASVKDALLAEVRKSQVVFYNTVVAQAQSIDVADGKVTFTFLPTHKALKEQLEKKALVMKDEERRNLQTQYDLDVANRQLRKKIEREVAPRAA